MDSSAPSIHLWVQVPGTQTRLLSIYVCIVSCEKDEKRQKEAEIGPFFQKIVETIRKIMKKNTWILCLGLELRTALEEDWKTQKNPLCYLRRLTICQVSVIFVAGLPTLS